MSVVGHWVDATITSGTTSAVTNLGRDYDLVEIQMPTIDSCDLSLMAAERTGGTYYDVGNVVQTVGVGGYIEVFQCGFQFIKIKSSVSQTSKTFRVRGVGL